MAPSKAQILERLCNSQAQAEALKNKPERTSFSGFERWRRATEKLISEAFGTSSDHLKKFMELSFSPIEFFFDGGGLIATNQEKMEHFNGGLDRANDLLSDLKEEVQTYWVEDEQRRENDTREQPADGSVSRKVFVVHGRDEASRESVARFLEKLDLHPIILHEQPNKGRTIIEKFEQYADVAHAVVLLTADDLGGLRPENSEALPSLRPRARQNVLFELGFFVGKLSRSNVSALYEEGVEIPSDYHGVLFTLLDKIGTWRMLLARELQAAGLPVDMNKAL